jgi:apolipoprotein N-acyltransferase
MAAKAKNRNSRIPAWLRPDWATALSAILIVFAFPPWGFAPLIWVALIPWFFALHRAPSWKNVLSQGLWLGIFMSIGGFFWVAYVLHEFALLPWPASILGLLLFSLIGQPQFLLFAPIQVLIQKQLFRKNLGISKTLLAIIALGLAYAGVDWVFPKLFADTLGHCLYSARNLRQVADLGGPSLLTFMVYFMNNALWLAIIRWKNRDEPSIWPAIASILPLILMPSALIALGTGYGHIRNQQIQSLLAKPYPSIQMGVIQANIGDFDKVAAEHGVRGAAHKILQTFFDMSDRALIQTPKPDALVWPETSYPSTFRTPESAEEFAMDKTLERYVQERNVPLLFGGYDHAREKDFNAFFFLTPKPVFISTASGNIEGDLQIYRKNILLLFGEYIPGSEYLTFLKSAFPQVGNFGRGAGPDVMYIPTNKPSVGTVRVSPAICYEVLFPNYIIEAIRRGSQMILNITNDSWFGPFGEPELHLALSVFRSIETRTPMLRSTNTGFSALILPNGEISHKTSLFTPEIFNVNVPLISRLPTLLVAWGDWFGPSALILGLLIILLTRLSVFKKHIRRRQLTKT